MSERTAALFFLGYGIVSVFLGYGMASGFWEMAKLFFEVREQRGCFWGVVN